MSDFALWLRLLHTRVRLRRWRGAPLLALMDAPARAPTAEESARGRALASSIARVARFVPHSRCLDRAVLLVELARRDALPLRLRIGVRGAAPCFRAHAWAEDARGEPYGDAAAALAGFAPLERDPAGLDFGR